MSILLWIPFILVRFGLLALLDKTAISRAAHFPPMFGKELVAYLLYQVFNVAIFVYMCFLQIQFAPAIVVCVGSVLYVIGMIVLIMAVVGFASPSQEGVSQIGIYKVSRNPMYAAYFIFFLGCVLLTQSLLLLGLVLLFQITAHFIILAEERWCLETFGEAYMQYMKQVRRYI